MARRPPKPCNKPGCPDYSVAGEAYCAAHLVTKRREFRGRDKRQSAAKRGYDARWRKARDAYLWLHPLCECEDCQAGKKRVRAATVVDHIIPHKGDRALFWDRKNWQAMSKPCHDRKTAKEDGGFGRQQGSTQQG